MISSKVYKQFLFTILKMRRRKNITTRALLLVGMLLAFSMLIAIALYNYDNLVGYSVIESQYDLELRSEKETMVLYVLGGLVLFQLVIYSVLLWKHYI